MLQSPVNMQLYMLPAKTKKPYSRSNFCPEEDSRLIKLIEQHGVGNWHFIAEMMPGRNVRQVKERWMNYLSPDVENSPWTSEEDALLQEKYTEIGSKWRLLAKFFPHRTDVNVKNRWRLLQRAAQRQVKKAAKGLLAQRRGRKPKQMTMPIAPPKPAVDEPADLFDDLAGSSFLDSLDSLFPTDDLLFELDF